MILNGKKIGILCIVLALLLLVPTFAACGQDVDDPVESNGDVIDTTNQNGETGTEYQIRYDDKGYEMDDLDIKGVNLGGKEVKILIGDEAEVRVDADQLTTPLNSAIFSRHMSVEKRLNCKLTLIKEQSGWDYRSSFVKKMQELMVGDEVNLVACYSLTHSSMMIQGMLANLGDSNNLDFSRPWWNQQMVDGCTIYDKIYFCSGDISHNLIGESVALRFNKELALSSNLSAWLNGKYGVDNMYDLVESGEWTIDKFYEICKMVYVDEDGTKGEEDIFGFAAYANSIDAFFQGCGMKSLVTGSDGSIMISEDMNSLKADGVMTDLQSFLESSATAPENTIGGLSANSGYCERIWKNGRSLFFMASVSGISREDTFEKGVLPLPKYDTVQEKYYTSPNFGYQLWGVARGTKIDYEELCGVLECLASEGYRKVTPAYFETTLANRQDSAEDYKMLYTIRDGIVIDGGRVMDSAFETNTWSIWRRCMMYGHEYLNYYDKYENSLTEQAVSLNSMMRNLEYLYQS